MFSLRMVARNKFAVYIAAESAGHEDASLLQHEDDQLSLAP